MSYIQTVVDEKQRPGMFILTESQNLNLIHNITQSLAGRTAILKLLPFSQTEMDKYKRSCSIDEYMLNGFFPAVYEKKLDPTIYYRNYYETYIERDLRQLIKVKDLNSFQTFVRLCAGRIGQLFNASGLANEVGVSTGTIKSWLSILQASFIIFSIEPFHGNISKRLVKSRKIYFSDIGLASLAILFEPDILFINKIRYSSIRYFCCRRPNAKAPAFAFFGRKDLFSRNFFLFELYAFS